jgi:putative membrane protein
MRGRHIALALGLVILVILAFGLFGGGMMGYGGGGLSGGWMGTGMMGGFGLGGGILMLFFWALIIGGTVLIVVRLLERDPSPAGPTRHESRDGALDILRERHARGEITKEQFDQMNSDLGEQQR